MAAGIRESEESYRERDDYSIGRCMGGGMCGDHGNGSLQASDLDEPCDCRCGENDRVGESLHDVHGGSGEEIQDDLSDCSWQNEAVARIIAQYAPVEDVLDETYWRMAYGKGAERHGSNLPALEQPGAEITRRLGRGFASGQAVKKLYEAAGMPWARARNEYLDAIAYIAILVATVDREENRHEAERDDF